MDPHPNYVIVKDDPFDIADLYIRHAILSANGPVPHVDANTCVLLIARATCEENRALIEKLAQRSGATIEALTMAEFKEHPIYLWKKSWFWTKDVGRQLLLLAWENGGKDSRWVQALPVVQEEFERLGGDPEYQLESKMLATSWSHYGDRILKGVEDPPELEDTPEVTIPRSVAAPNPSVKEGARLAADLVDHLRAMGLHTGVYTHDGATVTITGLENPLFGHPGLGQLA